MTQCDELRPSLGAYVLGALDVDEAAAVRRHLAGLPGVRRRARRADAAARPAVPGRRRGGRGQRAAVGRVRGAPAGRVRPRARGPAARARRRIGVACARGCGRAGWPSAPRPRWPPPPPRSASWSSATTSVRAAATTSRSAASARPGASARANLIGGGGGTTVHLWVKGLPRDHDAVYEVLCDAEMWTASAGTFRTDAEGHAYVVLTTALRKGDTTGSASCAAARGRTGAWSGAPCWPPGSPEPVARAHVPPRDIQRRLESTCDVSPGSSRSCWRRAC